MAKTVWVSLRRIKLHEIHTTLRYVRKHGEKWSDVFLRFGELQADATQRIIKTGSALLLYYLLLVSISDPYTVSVSFQSVEASIPTASLTLLASITFYFFLLQFQSVLMILGLRAKESSRLVLNGFSANAYGFLFGQDDMALVTPIHSNRFMREKIRVSALLTFFSSIAAATFLLPIAGYFCFLSITQIEIITAPGNSLLSIALASLGSGVLAMSIIFLVLFNVPLPMERHTDSIRWGFLSLLYPVGRHPRIIAFLEKEKEDGET